MEMKIVAPKKINKRGCLWNFVSGFNIPGLGYFFVDLLDYLHEKHNDSFPEKILISDLTDENRIFIEKDILKCLEKLEKIEYVVISGDKIEFTTNFKNSWNKTYLRQKNSDTKIS